MPATKSAVPNPSEMERGPLAQGSPTLRWTQGLELVERPGAGLPYSALKDGPGAVERVTWNREGKI